MGVTIHFLEPSSYSDESELFVKSIRYTLNDDSTYACNGEQWRNSAELGLGVYKVQYTSSHNLKVTHIRDHRRIQFLT